MASTTNWKDGLSVDVEDYYHVEAFAHRIRAEDWPSYPSRVARNTFRTLELLAKAGSRATFFVLGWVAEREPKLIREIVGAGHEIGCHSYWHRHVSRLSAMDFRSDTRQARQAIEDAAGQEIFGYRAPTFSIDSDSLWALEILAEEGFLYDSSIFPIRHDLYGMPNAPRFAFQWKGQGDLSIFEIPLTTVRLFGQNLPCAGGGYLRILPMWYSRWALRRVHERDQQPVVLYFHPWEMDPGQPRLSGGWKSHARHYAGLGPMEKKLLELLTSSTYVPLKEMLQAEMERGSLACHPIPVAP